MNNDQVRAGGASCKESRQVKIKCDGVTPCETCTKRGPQGPYPFGQLSGANNHSSLVGLEQQTQSTVYHMQNAEHDPGRANSLNTRKRPLSSGDLKDPQECRSIVTAQPCKFASPWLEDNYTAKRDSVPIYHPNGTHAQRMDTSQLQSEGPSNRLPFPFETVYTSNMYPPPLPQSIHAPTSSNTTSGVYGSGSGQLAQIPLVAQSRRPSHQVPSRRSNLQFSNPYGPVYLPDLAFPSPQTRRLVARSPWESEIGLQPPATSGALQFNGLSHPPSCEDVLGYTAAQGPTRGSLAGPELGWVNGNRVNGQVYDPASPKVASHLRATRGRKLTFSVRERIATARDHYPYQDDELRRKYPKERQHALELAIGFQKEHGHSKGIPVDLLDKLLEKRIDESLSENRTDDKYYCFCCPDDRKARTITPARDHVRKSLGNFPFRCPNLWCHHSSLRQADLNKHRRTCTSSAPKGSTSVAHDPEVASSTMQDQASVNPHSVFNATDSRPDDGNTYTGPPSAAGFQNYRA